MKYLRLLCALIATAGIANIAVAESPKTETLPSGVVIEHLKEGTGAMPTVNDTVVAQGEVVLVNDRYGVRLTRVVPSTDRLKSL